MSDSSGGGEIHHLAERSAQTVKRIAIVEAHPWI
jgi:hypothetical protein